MPTPLLWQNPDVGRYPRQVEAILRELRFAAAHNDAVTTGHAADFECGASAKFGVDVDSANKTLREVRFTSNGCGFMVAAAESIARSTCSKKLTDLHGTKDLEVQIAESFGGALSDRAHCVRVALEAFRSALAAYRSNAVEEFKGEKALICTCFGVDEETIIGVIESNGATVVSDVSAVCNAGSGCGSCQMLIHELIDIHARES